MSEKTEKPERTREENATNLNPSVLTMPCSLVAVLP